MIDKYDAESILARLHIAKGADFHTLRSTTVEALLDEANRLHYRQPKHANGSRGRYFHAYLQRRAR